MALTSEHPPPPRPAREEETGFERQGMVRWLAPGQLVKAGFEVLASSVFSRFVDKRELQGGLPGYGADLAPDPARAEDAELSPYTDASYRDDEGALWLDYAADTGEGFDPTYTVAWLLGRPDLELEGEGAPAKTKRGRLLILGGDQVYPGASWEGYRDRFAGPYRAALPHLPADEVPHLFAIPGNHDWYDGLTSFTRLFQQRGWVGAWRTRQRRSYFALRLSERWWLWATDMQLDSYMDGAQVEYFRAAAADLEPGHRVILATAKPSWTAAKPAAGKAVKGESSWEALAFVEERLIGASEGELAVTLSGDKHHYSHYVKASGTGPAHRITAGGGGAHTMGTNGLAPALKLPSIEPGVPASRYELGATSPTPAESDAMRERIVGAVMRVGSLGALIGVFYALLALAIADAVKDEAAGLSSGAGGLSLGSLLPDAGSQWTVGLLALLAAGMWSFADVRDPKVKARAAALHWLTHVLLAVVPVFALLLLLGDTGVAEHGLALAWIAAALAFAVGFAAGRLALGFYLLLVNRTGPRRHAGEIYGALASTDYKNFLRMKIDRDERLVIYPVGIPRSSEWRFEPSGGTDDPWFLPAGEAPAPLLIEEPIVVEP